MLWLLSLTALAVVSAVSGAGAGAARLVCYVDSARSAEGFSECTHLVYHGDARGDKLDGLLKEYRKSNPRLKIILRVAEVDKDLRAALKSKHVQGLEIHEAHRSLNKTTVLETVEAARAALSAAGGGPLFLALPSHPELLAKYYDLRTLVKKVDLMMVQTHDLGAVKKMTYHPSRLSGLWDMMNTDSVVDLVVGLGVPASKIVISLPATAQQFTLKNETLSTPGSPTLEDKPKEIDQAELCRLLQKGRWTLERDQDLSAPYAFKNTTWMSFEDSSSVDVKGKYARVRGLAGLALHKADRDVETPCGPTLKTSLAKVLNQQSRAPRAAVLRSLEHEILSAPGHARALDALQVSPYRITQIVDSDGVIHSIREDTRTEFSCSRQGYFVHPRSCARFYRCVKFDQLSPDYTVFEFDCPAGLAFDSRYEVCVWPGSLPHSQACPGSSEIAPVPRTRFICPEHEGYYADPENCRWFFACLDHGKAPLSAYEFRCPFGLGFDAEKLKCDWPWLVPACGNIARYEAEAFGYSGALLTGAAGFHGQTADAVNVAAHNSLVSGASLDNLVGIQGGFLSQDDVLDTNFIASQEFGHGNSAGGNDLAYQVNGASLHGQGLVQATKYNDEGKYTSGSLILDDYRLPTKAESQRIQGQVNILNGGANSYSGAFSSGHQSEYHSNDYSDNSGAYVHDPSGDYAEPYKHEGSPVVPYVHDGSAYKQSSDYYDYGRYSASSGTGQYAHDNSGSYVDDAATYKGAYNSGSYSSDAGKYQAGLYKELNGYKSDSGAYSADYSGSYANDDSGKYVAGVYRTDGHIGSYNGAASAGNVLNSQVYHGSYSTANSGNYISDSKAYTGGSHTLAAGSVNVGLVGKTTLVDTGYTDQFNYDVTKVPYSSSSQSFSHGVVHDNQHTGHVSYVSQPAVSINHVGTDAHNLDGYSFVTTPTSSGIPTTATPFAVTTAIPTVTYKTTFVPEAPKTSVKQIFGISQPTVTYVQPTVVPVKHYVSSTPKVLITDYNQAADYQYQNKDYSGYQAGIAISDETVKGVSSGYDYSKPAIKFEDGISYSTPAPISVSTYKPQGFSHSQQTLHKVESVGYDYSNASPVTEEPFKKIVAYTTGPSVSTYAEPTAATYTPQSFSHQTIHKVETDKVYSPAVDVGSVYNYAQSVTYEQPKTVVTYTTPQPALAVQPAVSTYEPQVYSHQTLHKVDASQVNTYSEGSGYHYDKPAVSFEETAKTVYQSAPAVVSSTYAPQSYSHQTIHKVENSKVYAQPEESGYDYTSNGGYNYDKPSFEGTAKTVFQHLTPAPAVVSSTYAPQSYSHQTIHKVENSKVYAQPEESGYDYTSNGGYNYDKPSFEGTAKTVFQHLTPAPAVVSSTYAPQSYSHQTIHKVENSKVYAQPEESGYDYTSNGGYNYDKPSFEGTAKTVFQHLTPAPAVVSSTYAPQSYSHQTIHKVENSKVYAQPEESGYDYTSNGGYNYDKPSFEGTAKTVFQHLTPAPAVVSSTYAPQSYSHQTIHKVENSKVYAQPEESGYDYTSNGGYNYDKTSFEGTAKTIFQHVTPAPAVVSSTYAPQSYSHQTIHKVENSKVYAQPEESSYDYTSNSGYHHYDKPAVSFETAKTVVQHVTPAPAVISTYTPQSYSHETIHKVESNKAYAQSEESGYDYTNHGVTYEQPQSVVEYTTAQPAIALQPAISTYQPQVFGHETVHKVDAAQVHTYSQDAFSGYDYQKPVAKFEEAPAVVTHYSTPAPAVVSTYKPQSYSHQTIHKVEKVVPVSSTPLPKFELSYQPVSTYENPILKYTQKVTPVSYVEPTATVFTQTYKPVTHQHEVSHIVSQPVQYETSQQSYNTQSLKLNQGYSYSQPEIQRDIETVSAKSYSDASEVSHQTYHFYNENNQHKSKEDIVFVSSTPATLAYEEHYAEYEAPKAYKAPEYIPPKSDYQESYVVSSTAKPFVQKHAIYHQAQDNYDYKPVDYSQQYETVQKYFPTQQVSFSTSHIEQPKKIETNQYSSFQVSYQSPEIQIANKGEEYLPPVVSTASPVVTSTYRPVTYSTTSREYLPPTPEPTYNAPEYLPPKTENTYQPPAKTYVKSTTTIPTYKYTESTTYKAPEYLPPLEKTAQGLVNFENFGHSFTSKIKYNPYQEQTVSSESPIVVSTAAPARKQNIVVDTAKSHLLGFGTVGPDAGLVSPATYTTSSPVYVSSTYSPSTVTSTYAPYKQELVEVTPAPIRRTKPKVAVVTKINDFNPLLVRKLGAVCSCQSPTVVLKGTRPKIQQQDYEDYNNDYVDSDLVDINDRQWAQKSRKTVQSVKTASVAPYVSTTINPIIVPDDSFYQDLPEQNDYISVTPKRKEVYSQSYVSSTPAIVSSAEKVYTIRPRIKAVTIAPTYKTVLLNEEVAPTAIVKEAIVAGSGSASIDSQSFDRYGPGGWRSRDETLQGSVDCQRAGLFRHPKQCNKFYACRWDCTKQRFTLHVFNCPVQLSFDPSLGACNWPSQGPACQGDTLLTNAL